MRDSDTSAFSVGRKGLNTSSHRATYTASEMTLNSSLAPAAERITMYNIVVHSSGQDLQHCGSRPA